MQLMPRLDHYCILACFHRPALTTNLAVIGSDICFILTRSLREPGGPCTKSMEISESRMEQVKVYLIGYSGPLALSMTIPLDPGVDRLGSFPRNTYSVCGSRDYT